MPDRPLRPRQRLHPYAMVLLVGIALATTVHTRHGLDRRAALDSYREESHEHALVSGLAIEHSMERIYEGLRTIARLPGIRAIDRYGTNLDENAHRTVQEIYNSLATSVAMSEVYVVPRDLDPESWDPNTGWMQAPIITFDALILNRDAGTPDDAAEESDPPTHTCTSCHETFDATRPPPHLVPVEGRVEEIELYEYRLMVEQIAWMAQRFPREELVRGLEYPAIGGREVITCDNTRYDPEHPDNADRSGLVISVPFYDLEGDLAGCISGVILTAALRDLIPGGEMALVHPEAGYVASSWDPGPVHDHADAVRAARPTPDLHYSDIIPLDVQDASGPWKLWVGRPNAIFEARGDVRTARYLAWGAYAGILILIGVGAFFIRVAQRHRAHLQSQNLLLEERVHVRTEALEREAHRLERLNTELEEQEERWRLLVEGTNVIAWEFDPGRDAFTYVSPQASRLGYPLAEWSEPGFFSRLVHPKDREEALSYCKVETTAGHDHRFQYRALTASGDVVWIDDLVTVTEDPEGTVICRGLLLDITAQKEAEEKLREARLSAEDANRSKSEFLANMSHEIRTPMTAILGFTETLLEEGDSLPKNRREPLLTIQRNGEHLLGIINDILDLSKIEAGRLVVEKTDCSVCAVIAEVATLMRVRARAKGIELLVETDGPLPETIECDPLRLRQILINLVGNAVKFTERGSVRIVARFQDEEPRQVRFDVNDSGIGMTEAQAARIFQPFSQADNTMSRRFGGTGLGLTISRRLAAMLGGAVEVVSTAPGVGTTFRASVGTGNIHKLVLIEDPMALISSSGTAAKRGSIAVKAGGKPLDGLRVLLAEDGPDNQKLISHLLRKSGAEVEVVGNGSEAVAAASGAVDAEAPFDVILMDMQMPVMNGYEASTALREQGYRRPIVALTAHAMSGERDKCITAGCDGFLTKPISRANLIEGVLEHVATAVELETD